MGITDQAFSSAFLHFAAQFACWGQPEQLAEGCKLIQAPTRWTASTGSFRGHHYSPHLVDAERRRALPGASFWEESALSIWARLSRSRLESFSVASRLVRRVASLTRRVYLSSRRL